MPRSLGTYQSMYTRLTGFEELGVRDRLDRAFKLDGTSNFGDLKAHKLSRLVGAAVMLAEDFGRLCLTTIRNQPSRAFREEVDKDNLEYGN